MKNLYFCIFSLLLLSTSSGFAKTHWVNPDIDPSRHAVAVYYGRMTDATLVRVLKLQYNATQDALYGFEATYHFKPTDIPQQMLQPLFDLLHVSAFEATANATFENDQHRSSFWELNPFIMLRWAIPTGKHFNTSFGFGEGVSWAMGYPAWEQRSLQKAANDRRLLNLLMFEVAVSPTDHPNWQMFYRVHHRSGVFGVYSRGIVGSTGVALGVRHWF